MNEKFNKNAKVEKFTNMLGIAVRLIVIDPLLESGQLYAITFLSYYPPSPSKKVGHIALHMLISRLVNRYVVLPHALCN